MITSRHILIKFYEFFFFGGKKKLRWAETHDIFMKTCRIVS